MIYIEHVFENGIIIFLHLLTNFESMKIFELYPASENELPSEYADRLGVVYASIVTSEHKKENGQFFTPLVIANYMAINCSINQEFVKILDPGCGMGVLSIALIESLIQKSGSKLQKIELTVYETDKNILPYLKAAFINLKKWIFDKDIEINVYVNTRDFILNYKDSLLKGDQLFPESYDDEFDVIISNPPYFKLGKNDQRVILAKRVINSQPNIYSIFLSVAANLLSNNGELIFITPRSFTAGQYFKLFRNYFFTKVDLKLIHLFTSRRTTFQRDKVLQETVIVKATKVLTNTKDYSVTLSFSEGGYDLIAPVRKDVNINDLIDFKSEDMVLNIPTNNEEEELLKLISTWGNTLQSFGINVSTGPVVSFRATDYLVKDLDDKLNLAPLIWIHNVGKFDLEWPKPYKERAYYISVDSRSSSILLPNKDYILVRRFSTKDDKSRLIASLYNKESNRSEFIGIENKVNYIYRKNGILNKDEQVGICALLNSSLYNKYFQIFNGNVNVSATELKNMRFPSIDDICKIGKIILQKPSVDIDIVIQDILKIKIFLK